MFRSGQDDRSIFYLLTGDLQIRDSAGNTFCITGGDIESCCSLTPHNEVRCKATAVSTVECIRLPSDLSNIHRNLVEGATVDEITDDEQRIDNAILFEVYHSLMSGDLVLPSLPDITLRIRHTADDPETSIEDLAKIIQSDAGTSGCCISVANSAAYGGTQSVANVREAVVRMGIQVTRDVAVAYTLRSLFVSKSSVDKNLLRTTWKHSCRIAALSYILAGDVAKLNPDRALLAGFLHDIGILLVADALHDYPKLLKRPHVLNQLCADLSGQIGAIILRAWNFPDVFVAATLEAEYFSKPVSDRLQRGDVVRLAHLHDQQPPPWSHDKEELARLPVFDKLRGQDVLADGGFAIVREADRELAELTRLLSN